MSESGTQGEWFDRGATHDGTAEDDVEARRRSTADESELYEPSSGDEEAEEVEWEEAEDDDVEDDEQQEQHSDEGITHTQQDATHTPAPLSLNESHGDALSFSLLRSSSSVSAASSTASFVHLPSARTRHSPVNPYGRASMRLLRQHAVPLTVAFAVLTAALIVGQIVLDLYYLIGLDENLLK